MKMTSAAAAASNLVLLFTSILFVGQLMLELTFATSLQNISKGGGGGGANPLLFRAGCDGVVFVSRSEWGARPPKKTPQKIGHPVRMSFIHHAETPGCADKAACIKRVKSIQDYHMNTRGWNDIGYSFLIGGDGRVYEGRGWNIVGAHTYGYNSVSLGFCLIGDFRKSLPTSAAIAAAKAVLNCGVFKKQIISRYELFGHRDGYCTDCPGDALYKLIQSWSNFSHRKIKKYCPRDRA